jgi:hypothetical protein
MTDPGPVELLRILAACGWPRFVFGRRVVEGESAWRAVTPSPAERRAVLARLGRRELLCVTPCARRRLRTWLDAQRRTPAPAETSAARRQRVERDLQFFGDEPLVPLVAWVIATLPRPVMDFAIAETMILETGRTTAAWTTGPLPALRPINVSGAMPDGLLARFLRHEIAHCWTLEMPDSAPTSHAILQARALTKARGWEDLRDTVLRDGEDWADWLAAAWSAKP